MPNADRSTPLNENNASSNLGLENLSLMSRKNTEESTVRATNDESVTGERSSTALLADEQNHTLVREAP